MDVNNDASPEMCLEASASMIQTRCVDEKIVEQYIITGSYLGSGLGLYLSKYRGGHGAQLDFHCLDQTSWLSPKLPSSCPVWHSLLLPVVVVVVEGVAVGVLPL